MVRVINCKYCFPRKLLRTVQLLLTYPLVYSWEEGGAIELKTKNLPYKKQQQTLYSFLVYCSEMVGSDIAVLRVFSLCKNILFHYDRHYFHLIQIHVLLNT